MFVGFKFNEWHCHYGTINNPSIMLLFVKDDAKTARKVETTKSDDGNFCDNYSCIHIIIKE